ncbi:MAG: Gfo/Idh/MocA family oxidoreductase [Phycisphaerales bacterium]|jgi:predicted dehydrogenase|nr:Gfo/Idh/MocA family oxidoreductase [Phycisphaerales bacterium]
MLKVGIIGLGMMGRTHYEAYQKIEGVEVVAIADTDPKRVAGDLTGTGGNLLQGGLQRLPMEKIKGYSDYRQLLESKDVDIIDICSRTPQHAEMAVAALATGKHVVCEKPLGRTVAEAQKIADAAAKAKGLFMPAMCIRFWPEWAWAKEAVKSGRYGKVLSAHFRRFASFPGGWYKDGDACGGAILDLHIHDSDFVYFLFGMPKGVYSRGYSKPTNQVDHVVTQYLYDHVPTVSAEGSWALADGYGFSMRYTINFENATADYDLGRSDTLLLSHQGKSEPVRTNGNTGYAEELGYFVNCVKKGEKPSIVNASDAVPGLKIVEAEGKSIREGKVVSL